MNDTVTADGLTKAYNGETALSGVGLAVPDGCLYGLIGADGAGKTTLLHILTTLLVPDTGSASVLGYDTTRRALEIRSRIGFMPQDFSLYHDLTVRENLLFFADIFGVRGEVREQRMREMLAFSQLGPFVTRRAENLSGGMKQKLALACCLMHRPAVLFLDEPTTGVDPISRREFWRILSGLSGEGATIIVSTPYMDEADMCERLALLHEGEMIGEGTPKELRQGFPTMGEAFAHLIGRSRAGSRA